MLRLLIASADEAMVNEVQEQLQGEFLIESCGSGKWALELLQSFSPDLLLLDAHLTDIDCISVLRGLRTSGKRIGTIFISTLLNDYVYRQIKNLNVDCVLPKPCRASVLIGHIRSLGFIIKYPNETDWSVEMEVDSILLDIGFRMGPDRYRFIKCAVLERYANRSGILMKQLYVDVVRKCGGNTKQVEKAIRDCIKAARDTGNIEMWGLLFRLEQNGEKYYPTNEEFITRIATSLWHKERLKPSYKELKAEIV